MGIDVTVVASSELRPGVRHRRSMTALAPGAAMLPEQWVTGPTMIEAAAVNHSKPPGVMTTAALRGERACVRVAVATRAFAELERAERRSLLAFRPGGIVTIRTAHLGVASGQ
jgi:hypothetical protein